MDALFVPFAEACRLLDVPLSTGYELNARGDFPVKVEKIGGRLKVSRYLLEQFARGGQSEPRELAS